MDNVSQLGVTLLKEREDASHWKQAMQMIALSKGDGFPRIFFMPVRLRRNTLNIPL
jgi:hypothetical protein